MNTTQLNAEVVTDNFTEIQLEVSFHFWCHNYHINHTSISAKSSYVHVFIGEKLLFCLLYPILGSQLLCKLVASAVCYEVLLDLTVDTICKKKNDKPS